ncbi:hypothetical protein C8J56DRAFT_537402 [Mycena floridula]|nr:hypothetical protein C8J56DRAFT_537402 [Mycena floridula]
MLLPVFLSFAARNLHHTDAGTAPDIQASTRDLYGSNQLEHQHHDSDHRLDPPKTDFPGFISSAKATGSGWYSKLKAVLNPDTDEDIIETVPNYRYTPILAGMGIPLSILLDIPGLTEHWYIRTLDNQTVETRPNPWILVIALAFSMACGVAANAALIVRFLEKRVKLMTILCILFLTLHDIINIVAVTVFGVEHRFDDGFTYGEPFWMTVCSTIVATSSNIILITDLHRTAAFDKSGSGLTRKQRSLLIIVMALLCYVSFGGLIHGFLIGLSFIDSLYFTICTIETIGFGDISPVSGGARVFSCVYTCFGIVGLALCVSLLRETIIEALEVAYRKRVQALRDHRRAANWKRRVFRRWKEAIYWRLKEPNKPMWVPDRARGNTAMEFLTSWVSRIPHWHSSSNWFGKEPLISSSAHPHGMHLNLEALTGPQLEAAAMEAGVPLNALLPPSFWKNRNQMDHEHNDVTPAPDMEMPLTQARLGRVIGMLVSFAFAVQGSGSPKSPDMAVGSIGMTPTLARATTLTSTRSRSPTLEVSLSQQYDTFSTSMEKEENKAFYARLTVVIILFITFWMTGSVVFMKTEGWSMGTSMYFCFVAFATIGFGDYSPKSPAGRSFFIAWAVFGVATMTILISVLSEAYSSRYKHFFHSNVFDRAVKRYQARLRRPRRNRQSLPLVQIVNPGAVETYETLAHPPQRAQDQLEALPYRMLALTQEFQTQMQYFAHPWTDKSKLPVVVQDLLDEVTENMAIGERHKQEILEDATCRQALFTLGIEKAIRKISSTAEEVIDALGRRDSIHQ